MGIDFTHFGLESSMVLQKFAGNYVWKYLLVQFQTKKKEREIWEFEMDLRIFFVCILI